MEQGLLDSSVEASAAPEPAPEPAAAAPPAQRGLLLGEASADFMRDAATRAATIPEALGFTVNGTEDSAASPTTREAQAAAARKYAHIDLGLPKDHWDPLADARWESDTNWGRESVLELRRIAYLLDRLLKLLTITPILYALVTALYYLLPLFMSERIQKKFLPQIDGADSVPAFLAYLVAAAYFFFMLGVPRSRGYTARSMSWNRPQVAEPVPGTSRWDAPGISTRSWRTCPSYGQIDMLMD